MNEVLNNYKAININNYDFDDLQELAHWADSAYDEISSLQDRLDAANQRLYKINILAEEM